MSGPGKPGDLDRLIRESEEAIQRLDAIQKARHNAPLLERVRAHFARNKAHVSNVLLAGTVLAVALGRLGQKQEHEVRPLLVGMDCGVLLLPLMLPLWPARLRWMW